MDLNSFSEAAEPTLRFLAMLSGPFYPILCMVNERLVFLKIGFSLITEYKTETSSHFKVLYGYSLLKNLHDCPKGIL